MVALKVRDFGALNVSPRSATLSVLQATRISANHFRLLPSIFVTNNSVHPNRLHCSYMALVVLLVVCPDWGSALKRSQENVLPARGEEGLGEARAEIQRHALAIFMRPKCGKGLGGAAFSKVVFCL